MDRRHAWSIVPDPPFPTMKRFLFTSLLAASVVVPCHAIDPGADAPRFEGKNLRSEAVHPDLLKGKVVVLEWNNFDCPFVKKHYASGNLPKLQEEAIAKGVVWLTVNSAAKGRQGYLPPSEMAVRAAKEGNKATHFLIDSEGAIGKAFGALVTPHMIIVNKDGKIAYSGAMDSKASTDVQDIATAEPFFRNALDAVIAGTEVPKAKNKPYGCPVKY